MHSRITLILPHEHDHRPPPPVVELHDGVDREACITFREADDESAELLGCPECLSAFLRAAADRIDEGLRSGRWLPSQ
jgi:hypothetical protein